jgi:hypothetical protein
MEENNTDNKSNHQLINGGEPHQLTQEDRRKGGSVSKFNALKHGNYASKLSQIYICPSCGESIPANKVLEQDAVLMKVSNSQDLYEEIKRTVILMRDIIEIETDERVKFAMVHKYSEQLTRIVDKFPEKQEIKNDGTMSMRELLDRIIGLNK